MASWMKKVVPRSLRRGARSAKNAAQDALDLLRGRRDDPLVPPTRLMFDGPQSLELFKENGEEFLRLFRELCALAPDEAVLDVGSGMGRKARPLTRYLSAQGSYEGFDIVPAGVAWCRERFTPRFPNFRFQLVPVYNGEYNPTGTLRPSELRFPYADASFDFAVVGSVFTHMLPDDLRHYFSEIARVLKPGKGRCLLTFFLLDPESRASIEAGTSSQDFRGGGEGPYRVVDPAFPEMSIAYDEGFVRESLAAAGLEVQSVHPGSWCRRARSLSYQDLIVAARK